VGYTAPVPDVLEEHHRSLDTVIVWCARTTSLEDEARFRWTIEIPWVLETYLASRSPGRVDSLMALAREGRVDIGAMHFSLQTDLCSPEELVRSLAYAGEIRHRYAVPVRAAMINDTPGFTWALAELLPSAGVPYLSVGMNSFLSDFFTTTTLPYLFRLRGQSGSEVLVWRNIDTLWAYLEGSVTAGVYNSYAVMESKLTQLLQQLQLAGYPYNEVLINCATGDNGAPLYAIVDNVRQWNQAHAEARLRIATVSQFFDSVSASSGLAIPVYSGDAPNWWAWVFAPSAAGGVMLSREAQDLIPAAEATATVASTLLPGYAYPADRLRRAYVQNLLFEDHNLGALDPAGNTEYWTRKIGWIDSARTTGQEVVNGAADALASAIPSGQHHGIVVFNPVGWRRSETVTIPPVDGIPNLEGAFDVVDNVRGQPVPIQFLSDGTAVIQADSLPPFGYRVFRLVPRAGPRPEAVPLAGNVLEDSLCRIRVNPATGGLLEVFDRVNGVEFSRGNGQFGVYRFNGSQLPSGLTVARSDSGPVLQQVVLTGSAAGSDSYEIAIRLNSGSGRVEIFHRYDKMAPGALESVDFWFECGLSGPVLQYEIPYGAPFLFDDELSGFRVNHYSTGRWQTVSSPSGGAMTLASLDIPLTAPLGGVFDGRIRMLASYTSASTAYRAGIGPLEAAFAVIPFAGDPGPAGSHRASYSFAVPPVVRLLPAMQGGSLPNGTFSFAGTGSETPIITAMKRADEGSGIILRLYNPSETASQASISSPDITLGTATECSLLEEDMAPLPAEGNGFRVLMDPFDVRTVRVTPAPARVAGGETGAAAGYELSGNFPNPFNSSTTIRFSLPERATVHLIVFDMLGRIVRTLAGEELPAGSHSRLWDGRDEGGGNCASGVYYCRLSAVGRSAQTLQPIRMVLIR
jgi:hypothetical protein